MGGERSLGSKLALAFAKAEYEIKKFQIAFEYFARVNRINTKR